MVVTQSCGKIKKITSGIVDRVNETHDHGTNRTNWIESLCFCASEFREAFKIFDVDNSETITTDELLLVMKNLGMMATKEEVKEMLSEVDEDGK